jgi:hypothetical protein
MQAYRWLACQHCGIDDGTVCGAHSNWAVHGKGKSIKASDDRCASLCAMCHHDIDQGKHLSEQERKSIWWQAHVRTIHLLRCMGVWPRDICPPDTSRNPF